MFILIKIYVCKIRKRQTEMYLLPVIKPNENYITEGIFRFNEVIYCKTTMKTDISRYYSEKKEHLNRFPVLRL